MRVRRRLVNSLSLLRIPLGVACGVSIVFAEVKIALWSFVIAVGTDLFDGRLARRWNIASPVGGVIDHGSDAFFVVVTIGCLAYVGPVPAVLAPLIAGAFIQYVLDSRVTRSRPLGGSWLGRVNGIAYFVLVGICTVQAGVAWQLLGDSWVRAIGLALVATTVVSMADRAVRRYRSSASNE